jgi:protease I
MSLRNKKIGIFIENNYQELEFWYPYLRFKEEHCDLTIIGPEEKHYKSKLGYEVAANLSAEKALNQKYDALIIPGGYAPDLMRICKPMLELVKNTYNQGNIIAAICHAAWVPISANIMSGKKATCYHTVKDDLINAGATYLDQSVVVDDNIITSRKPDDLPDFCREIIKKLLTVK